MGNYIFLTKEGYTFQPDSAMSEPDIENLQVIGFGAGKDSEAAFENFKNENQYIKNTSFKEVFSYKLDGNYESTKNFHYL